VTRRAVLRLDGPCRSAATTTYQALIEAEFTAVIGVAPHERTEARTAAQRIAATTEPVHDGR
jgi:Transposase, Mutator family